MARFYDTMNNADLRRVEGLLKKGGIVYTLRMTGDGSDFKEILVAEEDLADAEMLLFDLYPGS
jgi:hypothetical protein